jgi:hypothetical protein
MLNLKKHLPQDTEIKTPNNSLISSVTRLKAPTSGCAPVVQQPILVKNR